VPSDDVDNSKVVDDVHVHSEISSIIEDTSIDPCLPILNEIPMSSESTTDVVDALVESNAHITDETYVYKDDQESQETEIGSIIATPSMSSSSKSLEFLAMLHQVSSGLSSFSGCLEFSPEFFQISIGPSDVIPLAVFEACHPRELSSVFPPSFGVTPRELIVLHLPIYMIKPLNR